MGKKKSGLIKWVAAAACLCLLVGGIFIFGRQAEPQQPESDGLASITIPELNAGMGFEGYMVYDVSELDNGNPWSESMGITELPVYINGSYDSSGAGVPKGLREEEMVDRLKQYASALELEIGEIEVVRDGLEIQNGGVVTDPEPTYARAETSHEEIIAYADGMVEYLISGEGSALPEACNFTNSETTDEEAKTVLSYFIDAYGRLQRYGEPIGISYGDYTIYGDFIRNYYIYDGSGDEAEDILNYNFRKSLFIPNEKGNLSTIRIFDALITAQKVDDYPIISIDEAKERLINGNYQTGVPIEFPGEESIGKVELMYRAGRLEEIFLPYYRFYVLLPDDMTSEAASGKGLKNYGAYYVPALTDEHVVNMPTYDGRFN